MLLYYAIVLRQIIKLNDFCGTTEKLTENYVSAKFFSLR